MNKDLLYNSLVCYYSNLEKSKYLLKYLKYEKISLRIIDWFVTNYSKKYDTMYNLYNDKEELSLKGEDVYKQFNVFYSFYIIIFFYCL